MRPYTKFLAPVIWASGIAPSLAAQDVNGKPVLKLGDVVPIDSPKTYWTPLNACPQACDDKDPEQWTLYTSVDRLKVCKEPLLINFALHNPIEDGNTVKIYACTTGNAKSKTNALFEAEGTAGKKAPKQTTEDCLTKPRQSKATLQISRSGSTSSKTDNLLQSLEEVQEKSKTGECAASMYFGYTNGTIAGIYMGAGIGKEAISSALEHISQNIKDNGSTAHMISQLCGEKRNALHTLGVSIDTTGDLAAVQKDMLSWADAKCISNVGSTTALPQLTYMESKYEVKTGNFTHTNSTIAARADCRTISVVAGDGCGSLAQRCGISATAFTHYNPASDLCSKLQPDQRVCCSSGTLPDIRPKPNADGSCSSYLVVTDDNCSKLAAKYGLTMDDIEDFNKGTTWGWTGCKTLMAGINMCLSKGDPPMPAPVSNAVCGPTKPGSQRPTDGTDLKDINPCPLKACCNIWGQCGISGEFCIEKKGPTGNPGTAPKGFNGCVSSCGMDIVNDGAAAAGMGRVGYYETWNFNRPCLNMRAANAKKDDTYTILHWAFAGINTGDWSVDLKDDFGQWKEFKAIGNVKKVISFGGWGYSTEPATYDILRQAMSPAHRDQFISNVVSFVNKEGLDGVDFDWEYPGALDIPGTPPGYPEDGPNYLKFLTALKSKIGKATLSIAAPASFWYLKAFPIDKMAKQVDYIVYMTYDLHGQWDAGNQWSTEGCPEGNCLRSHVNLTETTTALSMITKAGVPTNKIYVGESSYGRSFKMSQAGCIDPMCKFDGDRLNSPAKKGRCTETGGYISDAEIREIIDTHEMVNSFHDGESNSDILVYDDTEWVAYMSSTTRDTRRELWKGKNFAGTINWAVDLQDFTNDDHLGPSGIPPDEQTGKPLSDCKGEYDDLDKIPADAESHCKNLYILMALRKILGDSLKQYDDLLNGGYEKKFNTYADAVVRSGNKQVEKFMYEHGKDYFDCVITEPVYCCPMCHSMFDDEKSCRFCEDFDCGWDSICDQPEVNCPAPEIRYKNITSPCPPDYSERSEEAPKYNGYSKATVFWTMRGDRKGPFFKDLYLESGIDEDNIKFKDIERYPCIPAESDEECNKHDHDMNFPVTDDYKREDVINPEDVVSKGYDRLKDMGPEMDTVIDQLKKGTYAGSSYDLVDALGLSIQVVEDAVDNMQTIDDQVDEWEEEKRKSIILAFLTAIFLFIPVFGEVAGAIGAISGIARIAALAGGIAGNVALDIYSIVDDPANAPLAIFSLILEPLALLDIAKIAKAASIRRGMKPEDVKALHTKPNGRLDKIDDLKNLCPRIAKRDLPIGSLPMSSLTGVPYDLMAGRGPGY